MNSTEQTAEIQAISDRIRSRVSDPQALSAITTRALAGGMDLETFRACALNLMPSAQPVRTAEPLDLRPRDWERYSIARAIRMQLHGQARDGLERELSDEISIRGKQRPEGLWIPREAFATSKRNYLAGTGTLGGMLIQTDNLASQFIELLRNKPMVEQLGARKLALSNPVTIPRHNAGGSVNWVGETVAATLSTGNYTQITLTPNGLSAFQQYSKALLFEGDPSIDSLIRDDISQALALEIDRVCLHGTGSGQPTGITATTGVTTFALGADGAAFTVANGRASMVSLESALANSNADAGSLAYLTNSKVRGRLKMIDENLTTASASWVWAQSRQGATVCGMRAEVSNQVSAIQTCGTATTICSSVFFGNWNEVLIGVFNNGAVDLVLDPYTLAQNAVVRVIAREWIDVGIRHGASFAVLLGVLDA